MTQKKIHIDRHRLQHQYVYRFIKRLFDVVASSVAVIILSPIFLIIAIAIKINDPAGPVFYTQTRVGKDEKPFKMFKFRSMVTNADELLEKLRDQNEVEGAMFKM